MGLNSLLTHAASISCTNFNSDRSLHGERERDRERERERERLDLNLTQEESDIANGLLQYRRSVSLEKKKRHVCQGNALVGHNPSSESIYRAKQSRCMAITIDNCNSMTLCVCTLHPSTVQRGQATHNLMQISC